MADFRLGRLKFNWRGNWTGASAYVIDDIVKFGANTFVCTANHTSVALETDWYSTDAAKWQLHTEGIALIGDWAASTFYKVNDIVKYGNDQYRCVTGHTSTATFGSGNFTSYVSGLKFEDSWVVGTEYQIGDIVVSVSYTHLTLPTKAEV